MWFFYLISLITISEKALGETFEARSRLWEKGEESSCMHHPCVLYFLPTQIEFWPYGRELVCRFAWKREIRNLVEKDGSLAHRFWLPNHGILLTFPFSLVTNVAFQAEKKSIRVDKTFRQCWLWKEDFFFFFSLNIVKGRLVLKEGNTNSCPLQEAPGIPIDVRGFLPSLFLPAF